jgi:hypothetical protein
MNNEKQRISPTSYDLGNLNDNSDESSNESSISNAYTNLLEEQSQEKDRYCFDSSMYNLLGRNITIKVYSHQLQKGYTIKTYGKQPSPNLFTVSANQSADNAAEQVKRIAPILQDRYLQIFYPPFSPRWSFSYDGCINNKGATKIFQERFDDELILRLQHRAKQGVIHRLSTFSGLKAEQIGHESLLQNNLKQTAPCWTRCIYHYPPLAGLIWIRWRSSLSEENMMNVSINLPKGWQNNPHIADLIIKACPFCPSSRHSIDIDKKIGNLEHLHLYCTSPIISDV